MTAPNVEQLEELPEDPFALHPTEGTIFCAFGRKKSGKSVFCRRLWRSWSYDAVAIDVNGDVDAGEDAHKLSREELTGKFPVRHGVDGNREHRRVVYRADPGSPTHGDDMDRAIGLALHPSDNPTLLWLDEVGEVSQVHRTKPNLRRVLMQSRHYGPVSALLAGPRPASIDPLCYLQADGIAMFELPNTEDRKKLAGMMGVSLDELDELYRDNRAARGRYAFLFFHAPSSMILQCPPLPYP